MSDKDIEKKWTDKATKALVGKKIVKVQYMTKKNASDLVVSATTHTAT